MQYQNWCTACMLKRNGIVANNGEVVRTEAIAGLGSVLLPQCRLRRTEPSPAERKFHAAACHRQSRGHVEAERSRASIG
jgi:hypothetical protein